MEAEKPFLGTIRSALSKPSWIIPLSVLTFFALSSLQPTTILRFPTWVPRENSDSPETTTEVIPETTTTTPTTPTTRDCSSFFRGRNPYIGNEEVLVKSVVDFGGVGDGITSNTGAFRAAVDHLRTFAGDGGSMLVVPKGRWLTGSFNLTSNFTLFLEQGALLLGSQDLSEWPLIEALPSYGRGRERLGGRHISLIHGNSLQNVVITGQNGSIDGQGRMWWEMWWNRTLEHTRGHLLEFINSRNILVYNLTFLNSPFWTIHPVYCSDVVIKEVTILSPLHSPNTDGIDPDSSTNVCIEDCYIESGDDLVAIKSGWDQYGITMARPSSNIVVRRVSGTTPTCSGVGIGSEMSGGITNVVVDDLRVRDCAAGVRIKTDRGRGGYVTNVSISNMVLERVKIPIRFSRGANDHPDDGWDPKALPVVKGIYVTNVTGVGIQRAPLLEGLEDAPFDGICMRNITLEGMRPPATWQCEFVSGAAIAVSPSPCRHLESNRRSASLCWPS